MKKNILGLICVLFLTNFNFINVKAAQPEGLAAHYIFNEGDSKIIKDYSGNGRDLKIDGNGSYGVGKEEKAFQFDGNTILRLPKGKAITSENITVAAFINIKDFNTGDNKVTNLFVNDGLSALGKGAFDFAFDANHKLTSYICGSSWLEGDRVSAPDSEKSLDTWIHVAVVYNQDSEKQILYINGKKVSENTMVKAIGMPLQLGFKSSNGSTGDDFLIGGYFNGKGKIRTFKGMMDDVRIYTRALDEKEINYLATSEDVLKEYKNYKVDEKKEVTQDKTKKEESKKPEQVSSTLPFVIVIGTLTLTLVLMIIYIVATNKKYKGLKDREMRQ